MFRASDVVVDRRRHGHDALSRDRSRQRRKHSGRDRRAEQADRPDDCADAVHLQGRRHLRDSRPRPPLRADGGRGLSRHGGARPRRRRGSDRSRARRSIRSRPRVRRCRTKRGTARRPALDHERVRRGDLQEPDTRRSRQGSIDDDTDSAAEFVLVAAVLAAARRRRSRRAAADGAAPRRAAADAEGGGAHRPHRLLGVGRHRRLALSHGRRPRTATIRVCR